MLQGIAKMVLRMMASQGTDAILRVHKTTEYNPKNPTTETITDTPIRCLWFDFTRSGNGAKAQDGTLIEMSDKELYVSPVGITDIKASGEYNIIHGGNTWNIKNVKKHCPDGTNVLMYVLTLAR